MILEFIIVAVGCANICSVGNAKFDEQKSAEGI